jgi:hypothetical protein
MQQAIHGSRLPRVESFEQAAALFEKSKPFDEHLSHERRLVTKREYDKRVLKLVDGSYRFIYHDTGLVTWASPTCFWVTPWSSQSSCVFTNRFLPSGCYVSGSRGSDVVLNIGYDKFVMTQSTEVNFVDGVWRPVERTLKEQFKYVVDQKKARSIRIKVQDYKNWVRVAKAGERMPSRVSPAGIQRNADLLICEEPRHACLFDLIGVPDELVYAALVAGGAVRKELLPVGALEKKSVFSSFL